jgi:hypothetical protein
MRNAFSLLAGTDSDSVNGYGVYFFLPKIVGKKVRGSLQDILEDSKEIATSTLLSGISPQEEKLRADFKGYKVIVNIYKIRTTLPYFSCIY